MIDILYEKYFSKSNLNKLQIFFRYFSYYTKKET